MEFLEVSDQLWRGPQPSLEQLQELRDDCGVTAVINLREESEQSRALCEELGLVYHYLPVVDWSAPHPRQVTTFLELLEQSPDERFLVHCQAGIGRTGVLVSCYRIWHGWMGAEEAIQLSNEEAPRARMVEVQCQYILEFAGSRVGEWE